MTEPTPPRGREADAPEPTGAPEPGRDPDRIDQVRPVEPIEPAALDPLDAAASAALDGLPSAPADAVDLDVDDELLAARIDELSGVTALLATPVPSPAPALVDAQIAAALAELTPSSAGSPEEPAGPVVVPLESRRHRPAVGRWLAVAAAIAVIALAIPVVQSLSKSSSKSSSTAASVAADDSANPDEASADREALSATAAPSSSTTTTASSSFDAVTDGQSASDGDIGTADDPVEMAALVHDHAPAATDGSTTQSTVVSADSGPPPSTTAPAVTRSSPPACDAAVRASHPGLGSLRYSATATYQTIPVVVLVYEVPDPTTITYRLIVARTDTCAVVLDVPYA